MLLKNPASTRAPTVSADDYFAALDFLLRMKEEKKANELNIELFTLLYGESCYEVLFSQGFFNPELN